MQIMDYFKATLLIMLFYSVSITILTYAIPDDQLNYVTSFSDLSGQIDLESISSEVVNSVDSQTNIPLVELGALVFYSGNILIDLLLNFAFAIPEMVALILAGLQSIFKFDVVIVNSLQLFLMVSITIFYFIGLLQLITGIRSGRIV
jgi:hypothetical protein